MKTALNSGLAPSKQSVMCASGSEQWPIKIYMMFLEENSHVDGVISNRSNSLPWWNMQKLI